MSHSDDRRRRLLSEDSAAAEPPRARANSTAGPPPGYSDAARREHQPRVTDLVPLRAWVHALAAASGALAVAAILSAYWFVPGAAEGRWPLLDVTQNGSLAAWLASAWLGCAAPLALLIYVVRRHRLDDYRGRYRMWLYATPVLLAFSLEQTADLSGTLRAALHESTGWSGLSAEALYWPLAVGGVVALLALRLGCETRRSSMATVGVALAVCLAAAGGAARLGWLRIEAGRVAATVLAGTQMGAALVLLASLGVYARHVILAAEGRLAVKVKRRPARAADGDKGSTAGETSNKRTAAVAKVDPPQPLRGPIATRTDLAPPPEPARPLAAARSAHAHSPQQRPASQTAARPQAAAAAETAPRKLSKAERKALKRQRLAEDDHDDWWDRGE